MNSHKKKNLALSKMRLESSIQWTKEEEIWYLTYGEDRLVSMGSHTKGIRPFQLEGRKFSLIKKSGFSTTWQIVNERNHLLMQLKFGFWNNKGKVRFNDGRVFECSYQTLPQFSIHFKDLSYGEKFISYQVDTTSGKIIPKLILHKSEMLTDKFLFLLSLGLALVLDLYEHEIDFNSFILLTTA
jgi:hypothetical protein